MAKCKQKWFIKFSTGWKTFQMHWEMTLWVMILFSKFRTAVKWSCGWIHLPLGEKKMSREGLSAGSGEAVVTVFVPWPGNWLHLWPCCLSVRQAALAWLFVIPHVEVRWSIWGWYGAYLLVEISRGGKTYLFIIGQWLIDKKWVMCFTHN